MGKGVEPAQPTEAGNHSSGSSEDSSGVVDDSKVESTIAASLPKPKTNKTTIKPWSHSIPFMRCRYALPSRPASTTPSSVTSPNENYHTPMETSSSTSAVSKTSSPELDENVTETSSSAEVIDVDAIEHSVSKPIVESKPVSDQEFFELDTHLCLIKDMLQFGLPTSYENGALPVDISKESLSALADKFDTMLAKVYSLVASTGLASRLPTLSPEGTAAINPWRECLAVADDNVAIAHILKLQHCGKAIFYKAKKRGSRKSPRRAESYSQESPDDLEISSITTKRKRDSPGSSIHRYGTRSSRSGEKDSMEKSRVLDVDSNDKADWDFPQTPSKIGYVSHPEDDCSSDLFEATPDLSGPKKKTARKSGTSDDLRGSGFRIKGMAVRPSAPATGRLKPDPPPRRTVSLLGSVMADAKLSRHERSNPFKQVEPGQRKVTVTAPLFTYADESDSSLPSVRISFPTRDLGFKIPKKPHASQGNGFEWQNVVPKHIVTSSPKRCPECNKALERPKCVCLDPIELYRDDDGSSGSKTLIFHCDKPLAGNNTLRVMTRMETPSMLRPQRPTIERIYPLLEPARSVLEQLLHPSPKSSMCREPLVEVGGRIGTENEPTEADTLKPLPELPGCEALEFMDIRNARHQRHGSVQSEISLAVKTIKDLEVDVERLDKLDGSAAVTTIRSIDFEQARSRFMVDAGLELTADSEIREYYENAIWADRDSRNRSSKRKIHRGTARHRDSSVRSCCSAPSSLSSTLRKNAEESESSKNRLKSRPAISSINWIIQDAISTVEREKSIFNYFSNLFSSASSGSRKKLENSDETTVKTSKPGPSEDPIDVTSEQSERTSITSKSSKNPDDDDEAPHLKSLFDDCSVFSNFSSECDNALRYRPRHRRPLIDRQRRFRSLLPNHRRYSNNYFVEVDSSRAESIYTPTVDSRAESESVSERAGTTRDVSDNEDDGGSGDVDDIPDSSFELESFPGFPDEAGGFSVDVSVPLPLLNFGPLTKDDEEVRERGEEEIEDASNVTGQSNGIKDFDTSSSLPTTRDSGMVWTRKDAYPHEAVSQRRPSNGGFTSSSLSSLSSSPDVIDSAVEAGRASLSTLRPRPPIPVPFLSNGVVFSVSEAPERQDRNGASTFLPKVLGRGVTIYSVSVRLLKPNVSGFHNSNPCTFSVHRRYREFRTFYMNMIKSYSTAVTEWPSFPKKSLFGRLAATTIAHRLSSFSAILAFVALHPFLFYTPPVLRFLGLDPEIGVGIAVPPSFSGEADGPVLSMPSHAFKASLMGLLLFKIALRLKYN
ncbi:hypothetical protein HDU67_003993 [Dinochytrium kinnereticum]|nr:hypothetical protein HDU67_003993 [Dinochytrium kinnereticum]